MNDRLLTPLRAAARDLIDKRLWPVALLLLVAIVAVPVVIGSSASEAPAPAPVLPAAKPATSAPKSAITVADTAVVGHSRPGAVSDPFFDPPSADATSGGTSTATAAGSTANATPSQSGTQSGSTTTTTTTTPRPTTSTPTTTPGRVGTTLLRTVFRPRLSFGETADSPVGGVSRLEALGGDANPALLYLGTTLGGGYAVFLLGPNALSQGDAECAETTCRVIAMKQGDTQIVGLRDEDGTARQFTVKIDDISRRVTDTVAAADKLRAREDADGRDVLRKMILDRPTAAAIGQFAYDRATGAVVARSDA